MPPSTATRDRLRVVAVHSNYVSLVACGSVTVDGNASTLATIGKLIGGDLDQAVLLQLDHFTGWDPMALADAVRSQSQMRIGWSKLAIVCDDETQQFMAHLKRPFLSDRVRIFEAGDTLSALLWLEET